MNTRRLGPGELAKYHALGNDYLVLDGEMTPLPTAASVRAWCSRHTGLGSDGLLVRLPAQRGGTACLRIFNPDGSEAEKSGNGLRIFARFLLDAGYAAGPAVTIELGQSDVVALAKGVAPRAHDDHGPLTIATIQVDMGLPDFSYAAVGAAGAPGAEGGSRASVHVAIDALGTTYDASLVSVGNPHCVVFGTEPTDELLATLGPALERHAWFANRTNVQLAKVVSRSLLLLRIWERGAGATAASGSSSAAAVAAAQARGLVADEVRVTMPGGEVTVSRGADGRLRLAGPALPIARAYLWPAPAGAKGRATSTPWLPVADR